MNDIQIRCFLTTCSTMNFSRSAELLNYTPQAVSRLIISLETELGRKLFRRERNGRSISLTPEGIYYMELMSRDKAQKERTLGDINGWYRWISSHFRLGISEWINPCSGELSDALLAFQRDNPKLFLSAECGDVEELKGKLMRRELDAVLLSGEHGTVDKDFGVTPVAVEEKVLIASSTVFAGWDEIPAELDPECWNAPFIQRAVRDCANMEIMRVTRKSLEEMGLFPKEIRIMPTVMSVNTSLLITDCVTVGDIRFGHTVGVPNAHAFPLPAEGADSLLCCMWSLQNENPRLADFIRYMQKFFGDDRPEWKNLMPSQDSLVQFEG